MHKDHIIIKYYSLFSFGDLLAIYFFIIHILEFSIKKTNGILKLETQWFTFFLYFGKLDRLRLFFIGIHSFASFTEWLRLLVYKQTNKQTKEHWGSIMNSWKNCTDHLFYHNTTNKFLNPDFCWCCSSFIFPYSAK